MGLVHLRLGANGLQVVVPDPLSKVCQCCCCCFDDPLVQFGVQGEVTGDGGAYVNKVLHNLKSAVANGDAWHAADVLAKDVSLLENDGEAKIFTSVCEAADE